MPELSSFYSRNPHPRTRMFARRKRKDEEEPLVPHGLVWQATEEAISEEKKFSAVAPAAKIPQTAPVPNGSAAPSAITYPRKKPVASSPPLFWRSQKKPELVYPAKALPATAPVPAPKIEPIEPLEHSDAASSLVLEPSTRRPAFASARERVADVLQRVSAKRKILASLSVGLTRQIKLFSGRSIVVLKLLRNELRDDYKFGAKWSARSHDFTVRTYSSLKLQARQKGRILTSSKLWARSPASLSGADLPQSLTARIPRLPKIRIRLNGLPLRGRIFFARLASEWKLQRHGVLSFRRLGVSSLLAVLSAMFVVLLVSAARNYGTASLPSHRLRSEMPSALSVLPVASKIPLKPPAIHADIPTKLETRRTPQLKHKRARPVFATTERRTKPRYNEEEDYVARDTYVYYGNKRAGSR